MSESRVRAGVDAALPLPHVTFEGGPNPVGRTRAKISPCSAGRDLAMKKLLPWIAVVILLGAGIGAPSAQKPYDTRPPAGDTPTLDDDERLIESAGLSSEGPGLLALFRARARLEAEPGRLEELVRRCSGPSHEGRIQA